MICGDEWDAPILLGNPLKNWKLFCDGLGLLDKKGNPNRNVSYLLDFAGYKEKGGEIETASHYREVKKVSITKTHTEIDAIYKEAGGEELSTAKEVKESVQKQKVWVQPLFEKEVGKEPHTTFSSMAYGAELNKKMPVPTEPEWKSFYRAVASCVHTDKGGDNNHILILNQLNEMYELVFSHARELEERTKWNIDYKIWKEDNGYKDDFVKEEELK